MSGLFDAGQLGWSSSMPGAGRSPEPVSTRITVSGARSSQEVTCIVVSPVRGS